MLLTAQLSLVIVAATLALEFCYLTAADYSAFILPTILFCIIFLVVFDMLSSKEVDASASNKDMIIRKVSFENKYLDNKALKDCKSSSCRGFSLTRNGQEFMPNANTKLLAGDLIILVEGSDKVCETFELLSGEI